MLSIRCVACEKESEISLLTRPISPLYPDVVEAYLKCPHCGLQTHTHFLSPALINKQLEMRKVAIEWQRKQSAHNFKKLTQVRQEYSDLYESEQKKYREFLDKRISLSIEKVVEGNESDI